MSFDVLDVLLVVAVLLSHVPDVVRGLLQDLRPGGLVPLHGGDGITEASETLLDVVSPLALQSVVVRAFVQVLASEEE